MGNFCLTSKCVGGGGGGGGGVGGEFNAWLSGSNSRFNSRLLEGLFLVLWVGSPISRCLLVPLECFAGTALSLK